MRVSNSVLPSLSIPLLIFLLAVLVQSRSGAEVITFDSLTVPAAGFYNGNTSATGPVRDNYTILGSGDFFGATQFAQEWTIDGVTFNNSYADLGGGDEYWTGWSWSNVQDSTTPGVGNQYAARPGSGFGGNGNYLVASESGAFFDVPFNKQLESVEVTNTTYAAMSMVNGDQFAKAFGGPSGDDADFYRVKLMGYSDVGRTGSLVGEVTVDLANYESPDNSKDFILNDWLHVSLVPIANARSVELLFSSSDQSGGYINTPTYLALDHLTFASSVPEPGSFGAIAVLTLFGVHFRRSRFVRTRSSRLARSR